MTAASRSAPSVAILDPPSFTPFYDVRLGAALAALGWDVEWITSRWELEDVTPPAGVRLWRPFFRALERPPFMRLLARPRFAPARRLLKGGLYPLDALAVFRALRARKAGILHVQWSLLPWLDARLWAELARTGWALVYTVHDARPLPGTTGSILGGSARALLRRADAVLVHDADARAHVLRAGAVPERVHVVAPGAPLARATGPTDRAAARSHLGLPREVPVVLFLGFVKPYKGLHVLLESVALVRREHPGVVLLIAGELQEKREPYDRAIEELRLAPNVRWMPRYVPTGDVGAYLAASDVVALPYLDASSSGVLLSAYGHARPVVATAVGGLPELVEPGATGLLVPPRDPPALAAALGRILADPGRAARMGERGHRLTSGRHAWDRIAAEHARIYREVADRSERRTARAGASAPAPEVRTEPSRI